MGLLQSFIKWWKKDTLKKPVEEMTLDELKDGFVTLYSSLRMTGEQTSSEQIRMDCIEYELKKRKIYINKRRVEPSFFDY